MIKKDGLVHLVKMLNIKKGSNLKQIKKIVVLLMLLSFFCGCGGLEPVQTIKQGEAVNINYTCFTEKNEVLVTTDHAVAQDLNFKKSRIFMKKLSYGPISVIAGEKQPDQVPGGLKLLDPEIRTRLAFAIAGSKKGRVYDLIIESAVPGMEDNNRYRTIKRVRTVPKIQVSTRKSFTLGHGREPVKGEIFSKNGRPYAKVVDIDAKNVTLELIIYPDLVLDVPWGKAKATAGTKDTIVITIETAVGTLVRTGGVIGVISRISGNDIIVDYGHPFAEEILKCRVETICDKPEK